MAPVTRPRITRFRPHELVRMAMTGKVRIPPIQRPFRWNAADVAKLFDSIYRGYPVGDLVLLESFASSGEIEIGPLHIEVPALPDAFWVVDGQQRITALVGSLVTQVDVADPRFRIFFDAEHDQFTSAARREHVPDQWIPIAAVLESDRVMSWLRERPWLDRVACERSLSMADIIREYEIPATIVRADDVSAARVIFERLNTTGKSLRSSEVFNAVFAVSGKIESTGLPGLAVRVRRLGFGDISDQILMQTALAVRGDDIGRDFSAEFDSDNDRKEAFSVTERILEDVIDFLRTDCGVPHRRLLPYQQYIPVLGRFLVLFGSPDGRAAELLRRWVWRCGVVGPSRQRSALAWRTLIRSIAGDPISSADRLLDTLPAVRDDWMPDLRHAALRSPHARMNVLALLDLRPKFLVGVGENRPGDIVDVPDLLEFSRASLLASVAPEPVGWKAKLTVLDPKPRSHLESRNHPFLAEDIPAQLDDRNMPIYQADTADVNPAGSLSAGSYLSDTLDTLASRIIHPPYPTDGLVSAITSGALDSSTLWSQCLDGNCVAALRAGNFGEFIELRSVLMAQVIRRSVQRRALFGFRDGPDPAALFHE